MSGKNSRKNPSIDHNVLCIKNKNIFTFQNTTQMWKRNYPKNGKWHYLAITKLSALLTVVQILISIAWIALIRLEQK